MKGTWYVSLPISPPLISKIDDQNYRAWRTPSIFQALPSVLQAAGIFFLPESPRWLVSKGREQAALNVLAHYHGNDDREDEVVQFEYQEIVGTIEAEIAAKQTQWSEIWKGKGNKWRIFIMIWFGICKQWSGNGVVSYYLHTVGSWLLDWRRRELMK